METRFHEVKSRQNGAITMRVTPGHFATRHSHINYYVDLTKIKNRQKTARLAGQVLAEPYLRQTPIDTIVCMEGTEIVAGFTALALSETHTQSMNAGSNIAVVTPEINTSGQLIFRDNLQPMIYNQGVLLLVALATTGITITQTRECIEYYGGRINGISAIFSAIDKVGSYAINSIFSIKDVPDYQTYLPVDCPKCKAKLKIDALANSYGYSKL